MTSGQILERHPCADVVTAAVCAAIDVTALPPAGPAYSHMGALIADAALQAGLTYATVVKPRVDRLLAAWPSAYTTSRFLDSCLRWGLVDVLQWTHPEKLQRTLRLTILLNASRIDTVDELARWAPTTAGRNALLATPGIGPKTADYIAGLAGAPSVAIDRHLIHFAQSAGASDHSYDGLALLYRQVAAQLNVDLSSLDRAIWRLMSANDRFESPLASRVAR